MSAQAQNSDCPSLCLPRVFPNITRKRIADVFDDLNIGDIERIDMVNKTNQAGARFKRVFIHFKRWYNNEVADEIKEKVNTGKPVEVIYDDPWFWKVFKSNVPKPEWEKTAPKTSKPATVQMDELRKSHARTIEYILSKPGNLEAFWAFMDAEKKKTVQPPKLPTMTPETAELVGHGLKPLKLVRSTARMFTPSPPLDGAAAEMPPPPLPLERAVTEMPPSELDKVMKTAEEESTPRCE